jgi:fructose-bisphosphate aldolase/2-amino-3,7-dideoxy-D-threo-hept-6-ulosonate synthase
VAAELGADIVKTVYTGDPESFREVTRGCPVPVVVAGGSKTDDRATFEMIEGAMSAGAAGISIGRNAFQHESPVRFIRAASVIVHQGRSVEEAMEMVRC